MVGSRGGRFELTDIFGCLCEILVAFWYSYRGGCTIFSRIDIEGRLKPAATASKENSSYTRA